MKKNVVLVVSILLIAIIIIIAYKIIGKIIMQNKDILVKISKIEYNDKGLEKIADNGFYILSNGDVYEYNEMTMKCKLKFSLTEDEMKTLKNNINCIDEKDIISRQTNVAITSGIKISVMKNSKEIFLKDFYSQNYSNASIEIINFLNSKGISFGITMKQ